MTEVDNKTVTVFTPTHNRCNKLYRLYQSLCNQSNKDFEWIIVNDACEDDTDKVVEQIFQEKKIPDIKYKKNEFNMGMCYCIDEAVSMARGLLFFKVDDDDELRDDAIELIIEYEKTISGFPGYAGVSGLRCSYDGKTISREWSHDTDFIDATNLEREKFGLQGDKAEAYYTDVLKQYGPHPYIEGEPYSEFNGILCNRIAHAGLKIRWFNEKIYYCEYYPDGSTSSWFKNCRKYFVAYSICMNEYKEYTEVFLYKRIQRLSKYFAVGFSKHYFKKKDYPSEFCFNRSWLLISYSMGFCLYVARLILKRSKYRIED